MKIKYFEGPLRCPAPADMHWSLDDVVRIGSNACGIAVRIDHMTNVRFVALARVECGVVLSRVESIGDRYEY